jgi:hypothetical protein
LRRSTIRWEIDGRPLIGRKSNGGQNEQYPKMCHFEKKLKLIFLPESE